MFRVRELASPQDRAQAVDFAILLVKPNLYAEDRITTAAAYAELACPVFAIDRTDLDGRAGGFGRDDEAYAPIYSIAADDNFLGVAVCSVKTKLFPLRLQLLDVRPEMAGKGIAAALCRQAYAAHDVVLGTVDKPALKRWHERAGIRDWIEIEDEEGETSFVGATRPFPHDLAFGVPFTEDVDGALLRAGLTSMLGDL